MKCIVFRSAFWQAIDRFVGRTMLCIGLSSAAAEIPPSFAPGGAGQPGLSAAAPGVASGAIGAEVKSSLLSGVSDSYRIQPMDVLLIDVVNEPKLAMKEFRVAANGAISYPFIGSVPAAGRTTFEVQEDIKRLLETDYLVNAQVLVHVREYRTQQVAVYGEVNRPSLVDIPPERKMTVLEAITAAGGFTRLARKSNIEVLRAGSDKPMRYDLDQLQDSRNPVYVEAGDSIYVHQSRI